MVKRKGFRQQSSLRQIVTRLTAGNLAYLGAQFVAFLALTQWASVAEVGRFSWALALTSPIFVLADMRTRQVQLSTSPKEFSYRSILAQRMLTQLTALPLVLIMGEVFSPDQETTLIVWGFSLLKLLEGLMNVAIGEHLRFENSGMVANIQLLRGGIYAVTFSTAIFLTSQAAVAVWAVAIALTLPALLAHLSLGKRGRIMRATRREIIGLTQQAWPLGIGFFVGSVTVNGPRFLVEMYHGVESLAVFTAVSYVVVLSNTIVDSVTQGIMPRLARYWGGGKDEHVLTITKKVSLIVATLGFIGIVIAIIVGDRILALLFGLPYASGQTVLIALFSYATLQYVASTVRSTLIAGGVRKSVLWVSLVNLTVTLASSFLLVPLYGPESAGWSLAIGQIVQLAMYLYLVKALGKAREVKFEGGALE